MKRAVGLRAGAAALSALALAAGTSADKGADETVRAMLRPLVSAPEVTARVLIERSDPFGGPPRRESGRVWYLRDRGLRFRSEKKDGQHVLIDRVQESFLLHDPADAVLYRAPFARAPGVLRELIVDPRRILEKEFGAKAEKRAVGGVSRVGYRLRPTGGDSLRDAATWIAADPGTGHLRWIAIDSEAESVLVELADLSLKRAAQPRDLALSVPHGTREEPLDPRALLDEEERGESR